MLYLQLAGLPMVLLVVCIQMQFTPTAAKIRHPPCPCKCTTNIRSIFEICAGFPSSCKIVRCLPRVFGLACCDKDRSADGPPISLMEARGNLNTIDRAAERAAKENPILSRSLARILNGCIKNISMLITAGEEGIENSRQILVPSIRKGQQMLRMRLRNLIRGESRTTLQFIVSLVIKFLR